MPSNISGGMQKRVGLARALALDPSILLLDEPTAGLDPITSREIDELILKLQEEREVASIVVTHDLHSAKLIADRIVLLHQGNAVIEGTFDELERQRRSILSRNSSNGIPREHLCQEPPGWELLSLRRWLILAAGIFIIGDRQYLFSSTYRLKAQFSHRSGPGCRRGSSSRRSP